jgi:predicted phage terminase large subunit-like protein
VRDVDEEDDVVEPFVLDATLIENFARAFIIPTLPERRPSPPFHRVAWHMVCDPHPYVAMAAPRGHAKSTGITFIYVLCCILFRTRVFPVIVSNTHAKAKQFVSNLKNALLNNMEIRKQFRVSHLDKEAEDDFIVVFKDGHRTRVTAIGFGMSCRGLLWDLQRPDLIIGDDMEDDEQVLNPERREKAADWFLAALLPVLSESGIVRLVGTIVHTDCLLQNCIEDNDNWISAVWEAHDDNFANLLWPQKFTPEMFKQKYALFKKKGKTDKYSMEYRNKAVDKSSGLFKEQNLLAIEESDWLLLDRNRDWPQAIGGDFAISIKQKRDFTVFLRAIVGPEFVYVVNVVRQRMESKDIVDTMFSEEEAARVRSNGQPAQWFEEDGAIRKALGFALELEMKRRGVFLNLCPMNPGTTDKRTRSMPAQARVAARVVKFDHEADWWPALKDELLSFDKGRNDDQVDAFSWLCIGLSRMIAPNTPAEEDEEDYFEAQRQVAQDRSGRNKVTGY